jgi:hypothetical protein
MEDGCYNETTDLPNTTGVRALSGGTNLVAAGNMTVEMCWAFCRTGAGDASGGKSGSFKFAGLEYARYVFTFLFCTSLLSVFSRGAGRMGGGREIVCCGCISYEG